MKCHLAKGHASKKQLFVKLAVHLSFNPSFIGRFVIEVNKQIILLDQVLPKFKRSKNLVLASGGLGR